MLKQLYLLALVTNNLGTVQPMKDILDFPTVMNIPVSQDQDQETNVCYWLENKTRSYLKAVCLVVSFHKWRNMTPNKDKYEEGGLTVLEKI